MMGTIKIFWEAIKEKGISEEEAIQIGEKHKEILKQYFPEHLSSLSYIAKEMEIDHSIFLAYWALKEQLLGKLFLEECTSIGVTGVGSYDGQALIAGTSDRKWSVRASVVCRAPEKGYRYLAVETSQGMIRAMNEKGFCFGRNGVFFLDPKYEKKGGKDGGISIEELTLKMIQKCSTVGEAIEMIKDIPRQPGTWKILTLADASGNLVIAEVTPDEFELIEPDRYGWLSITNHFLSPKFRKYERSSHQEEFGKCGPSDPPEYSSFCRYKRTLELREMIQEKKADPYMLMKFISDIKNLDAKKGVFMSISSHGKKYGTIFCYVMQPVLKTFWYCYGPGDGKILWKENTWGHFVPFALPQLEPGQYVTAKGTVSPKYPFPFARKPSTLISV